MDKIVCISREFGSGGHDIGLKLAEKLNVPFYDRSLSEIAASNIGVDISRIEDIDEKSSNSFMYSLVMGSALANSIGSTSTNITSQDRMFAEQARLIEGYADDGPCVIVGRCSGYILKDNPKCINIFICSSYQYRLNRIMKEYKVNENNASTLIRKKDKMRATYFQHYTNNKWGVPSSYDLCVNTDKTGIIGSVELLSNYLEK